MYQDITTKNKIAKDIIKSSQNQIDIMPLNSIANISSNICKFEKDFWLGNFKISIKIH